MIIKYFCPIWGSENLDFKLFLEYPLLLVGTIVGLITLKSLVLLLLGKWFKMNLDQNFIFSSALATDLQDLVRHQPLIPSIPVPCQRWLQNQEGQRLLLREVFSRVNDNPPRGSPGARFFELAPKILQYFLVKIPSGHLLSVLNDQLVEVGFGAEPVTLAE